jgi:6-pyruvoyltetrahydropterin/6-carboxytetrahydropterin synthase
MYKIKKRIIISAAHYLNLDYQSKCTELHGHNWVIDVYLRSKELNKNGMIMDFTVIKQKISDALDHKILNNVLPFNPTAENLAKWICDQLSPFCYRVDVEESPNNCASYELDD